MYDTIKKQYLDDYIEEESDTDQSEAAYRGDSKDSIQFVLHKKTSDVSENSSKKDWSLYNKMTNILKSKTNSSYSK